MINPTLFHDCICRMTRFDLPINSYIQIGYWTEPYVMITFTMSYENAAICTKYFPDLLFIFSHLPAPAHVFLIKMSNYIVVQFYYSVPEALERHILLFQPKHQKNRIPVQDLEHHRLWPPIPVLHYPT